MNTSNEDLLLLQQKAKLFFDNQYKVHLSFKRDYWKRGFIKEVSADFFLLDEVEEGYLPVFFLELKDIQLYKQVEKKDDK